MNHPTTDTDSDDEVRIGLGDLVAIVLSGSTPVQPLVELGQILRTNSDCSKFCYVPFRNAGGNTYRCHVGCVGRAVREDIVFPVGAEYDKAAKLYRLLVDPLDIHNAKFNTE